MSPLPAPIRPKLGSLLRMLASPIDGEALGAARAIGRTLTGAGVDFHVLADTVEHPAPLIVYRDRPAQPKPHNHAYSPKPEAWAAWSVARRRQACELLEQGLVGDCLTSWELDFVRSVIFRIYDPHARLSSKQIAMIERLLAKIGAAG